MKIAIDITPLKKERFLWHRVRGTGFYIENLKKSLEKYFPENQYIFFTRGELLPKNIDLVHYPYFEPFFLTLPLFKQTKTVVTVHDLIPLVFPTYFPPGIKGKIKWMIQNFSLKNTGVIITDSESSKKDIARFTGIDRERIKVIYLAPGEEFKKMEYGTWNPELRQKYNLPEKFVLYVGDATWNKNLPKLVGAVKTAGVPLVMVGKALLETDFDKSNPWNRDLIKVQKMAENDNKILRLGFVATEDLVKLYNTATVFAMPSIYEGFGLPLLEAMACGCPTLASDVASLSEIGKGASLMVTPYDIKDIAGGIKKIFDDRILRASLAGKGLNHVRKFTWEKTARETVQAYKSLFEDL